MTKLLNLLSLALATVVLSGCAVGNTHSYNTEMPQIAAVKSKQLAVGVQDKRIYVLNAEKPETFTGLSRGGFGNPFDINTGSGQPLASDFAASIKSALVAKGVTVSVVEMQPRASEAE